MTWESNRIGLGYHYSLSKCTRLMVDVVHERKIATNKNGYDFGIEHSFWRVLHRGSPRGSRRRAPADETCEEKGHHWGSAASSSGVAYAFRRELQGVAGPDHRSLYDRPCGIGAARTSVDRFRALAPAPPWQSDDHHPHHNPHVVLSGAESDDYRSLRRKAVSRAERFELGRRLRLEVPRKALGDWRARRSGSIRSSKSCARTKDRSTQLIPIRVGRMVASPYGFLRGTPMVMAADVAGLPATGITPVICGDAHLGNFGFYASPERDLVFDLNDFDEAHPGAWEWDLRRLVASIWVAGRQNGCSEAQCADRGDLVRRRLPRRSALPGRPAAAVPLLPAP